MTTPPPPEIPANPAPPDEIPLAPEPAAPAPVTPLPYASPAVAATVAAGPTTTTPPVDYAPPALKSPPRLDSLDIFRGLTIAGMLLVNNPGTWGDKTIYSPLRHADWHGWTPTDLVFPFFLFIMGVAIPFSFAKRKAADSKFSLFLHILARALSLIVLGILLAAIPGRADASPSYLLTSVRILGTAFVIVAFVALLYPWKSKARSLLVPVITAVAFVLILLLTQWVNDYLKGKGLIDDQKFDYGGGIFNPWKLRLPGVLQRIGICYAVAASLVLFIPLRPVLTLAAVAVMAAYSYLMLAVPYPSLQNPGTMVHGLLEHGDNFARYVDVTLMGWYRQPSSWGVHNYSSYPDPEGIISTLPAIATAVLGVLAGMKLRSDKPLADRCASMLAWGVILAVLGYVLDSALMPINKPLWTPSYTVFCAGLAMMGLGTFFYLVDVKTLRWPFAPLKAYGMNAITAFVLAGVLGRVMGLIRWHPDADQPDKLVNLRGWLATQAGQLATHVHFGDAAKNASLAYALCFVLAFGILMYALYKFRIFLKV